MGKIAPYYIKSAGYRIMKMYPDRITTDFQLNKLLVEEITDIQCKSLRNKLAGYLVGEKKKEGKIITPPIKRQKIRSKKDRKKLKRQRHRWI